jgi:predicted metalloprotease with PDZ domain
MSRAIHYEVVPSRPSAHYYTVRLELSHPDPRGEHFSLPAWIPGSYMIRDFARNIVTIRACSGERELLVQELDKQRWRVEGAEKKLLVEYRVYAWDLSVRAAHLDRTHGFFNGTSLFLRVEGEENTPCRLRIAPPREQVEGGWKVATTLPVIAVDDKGFGVYQADGYWHLIDCPVEMADYQSLEFEVQGRLHTMVVTGRVRFEHERLAADLQKICEEQVRVFGELPVSRYLFLVMATGDGYGGLEHRDSTALICARTQLPAIDMKEKEPDEGYRRFLGLCSHEYFHLWNVKRICPRRLAESDLSAEAYTQLLWAFEGITSYYDDLALVRSGCIGPDSYLELLAQTITRVMQAPGRRLQSLAQSSFHAWTKFYKQDENAPNAIVSYYAKGALVALGLDVTLRMRSRDRLCLDDLMRQLWQEYGKPGKGVPEEGIQRAAEALLGESLEAFFALAVEGTGELPLESWLEYLGIGYRLRPSRKPDDQGGYCRVPEPVEARPTLGAHMVQCGDFVKLGRVLEGGVAQQSGLSAGDRLISIAGLQVSLENIDDLLRRHAMAEPVEVLAFRRDELMRFQLQARWAPNDTCDLWLLPAENVSPAQLQRRRHWLKLPVQ